MTGPMFGWSEEALTDAFDAVNAPWYQFGVQQQGPMFAIQDQGEVRWIDPSAGNQTINVYFGRQRPFIVLGYYLMGGLPIYHAMGNKAYASDVHTFFPLQTTGNYSNLPVYQTRYQDDLGPNNVIFSQMNNKTHSLRLTVDRMFPMRATEMIMGTDRWISDNSYWEDGATVNGFYTSMMTNPTTFYTGTTTTAGFELDGRSSISINSNDVTSSVVRFESSISMFPKFNYIQGVTFQEEIWPNSLIENIPPIVMGLEIDMLAGVELDTIRNTFSSTDFTTTATFYSQDPLHYITIAGTTTNYRDSFLKMADPIRIGERLYRVRLYCPYTGTSIKVRDGVTSIT